METNTSHVLRGVEAVVDSAHTIDSRCVWVDAEDVPKALQQISKLSGVNFANVKAFTHKPGENHRSEVAIKLK